MASEEPQASRAFWTRAIGAAGEAMFPKNDLGAPDFEEVDIVDRTIAWMDELPPPQRRLVVLLFTAIELGAPVLGAGLSRFSRLSAERRLDAIRRWRRSGIYLVRLIGESLKGTMSMIYLSHPSVLRHIGMFKTCEHEGDPLEVEIRKDALRIVD